MLRIIHTTIYRSTYLLLDSNILFEASGKIEVLNGITLIYISHKRPNSQIIWIFPNHMPIRIISCFQRKKS